MDGRKLKLPAHRFLIANHLLFQHLELLSLKYFINSVLTGCGVLTTGKGLLQTSNTSELHDAFLEQGSTSVSAEPFRRIQRSAQSGDALDCSSPFFAALWSLRHPSCSFQRLVCFEVACVWALDLFRSHMKRSQAEGIARRTNKTIRTSQSNVGFFGVGSITSCCFQFGCKLPKPRCRFRPGSIPRRAALTDQANRIFMSIEKKARESEQNEQQASRAE